MAAPTRAPLSLNILGKCSTTKARVCKMILPHKTVDTPVYMPVGTQGTLKGVLPEQLEEMNCQLILSNTYHLGHRPVSTNYKVNEPPLCTVADPGFLRGRGANLLFGIVFADRVPYPLPPIWQRL